MQYLEQFGEEALSSLLALHPEVAHLGMGIRNLLASKGRLHQVPIRSYLGD